MKRFDYLAPQSLPEALEMLSARPEAVPMAGGTDVLTQIKSGQRRAEALLSLKRVPEVHPIVHVGQLTVGSAVSVRQIAAHPQIQRDYTALAIGAGLLGTPLIRAVASVGGNLCNAAPSADTAPSLLVLGARAVIAGPGGERTVPLEEFFVGPGRTVLQPGELLKEIVVPQPADRSGSFYLRHTPRARVGLAVVGVAAAVVLNADGTLAEARLALGAVAPVPMRARQTEELLRGQLLTDEVVRRAGAVAAQEARPIDDLRASAEYRRHLVNILTQRALRGAYAKAKEGQG